MLLAIDAGNTNIVFALFKGKRVVARCRFSTDPKRTADELAVQFTQFLELKKLAFKEIDYVIISSVVPPLMYALTHFAKEYCGVEPMVVGRSLNLGAKALVDHPAEVGADRLVNTVAAYALAKGPCIVVDFGTATTFDVVDGRGNYRGGVIAPGINLSLDALQKAAARLPEIEIARPDKVIGTNTVRCMQSGIYFGYASLIEGIIARLRKEMLADIGKCKSVIATGGLASLFAKAGRLFDRVEPELTLNGLYLIYEKNKNDS